MIGLILRVRMPILKGTVTCQNSQKGVGNDRLQFTENNKKAVQTLKPSSAQKNTLWEFLVIFFIRICLYKFAHWFSSIFQSLQMHCRVFCNLADSSRLLASKKKIQEIIIFTAKNKTYYMWLSRSRHFRETKETKVISPQEKSVRLKLRWPTGDMLQIKKLLQIK